MAIGNQLFYPSRMSPPDVEQPWYADDAGAGGTFAGIREYFKKLLEKGPRRGYFPKPSKNILILQEHNKEAAENTFKDLGFTVVTSSRYTLEAPSVKHRKKGGASSYFGTKIL
jgi:hypothetical protein